MSYGYKPKKKQGYGYGYKAEDKPPKTYDTPHKNEFGWKRCIPAGVLNRRERKMILDNVKEHDAIIYGSTSAGLQAPGFVRKPFTDVDVLAKKPLPFARETERELDAWANHNCYYVEELVTEGKSTFRIRNRCRPDSKGQPEVVADISPIKPSPKTIVWKGMRLETLASRENRIREMLADPEAAYRRKKDIENLGYVVRYRRVLKR